MLQVSKFPNCQAQHFQLSKCLNVQVSKFLGFPSLEASDTPINISVENNAVFGEQTRRFAGVNVEHQFNENFMLDYAPYVTTI